MKPQARHTDDHSPVDVSRITGVRIHGDSGVTPVDLGTARIIAAGGEHWLYWTHQGIERAVNYRHLVEVFCDPTQLTTVDLTEPAPAAVTT